MFLIKYKNFYTRYCSPNSEVIITYHFLIGSLLIYKRLEFYFQLINFLKKKLFLHQYLYCNSKSSIL